MWDHSTEGWLEQLHTLELSQGSALLRIPSGGGGWRGGIGGWEALDPSSPFKECCLFRPLTSGLSLFFLISTALRGGDGDLDFCYRFGGPGPGRLETDPAVQMRIQRLAFAHREVERPSSCFLCSLSELYQCQEGKQFSA